MNFCSIFGYRIPLQAKLWGIRRTMKLANERAWLEATIETGWLIIVNLIKKEKVDTHSNKTLIKDCKKLKEVMLLDFIYISHKGNKCVNCINKFERV